MLPCFGGMCVCVVDEGTSLCAEMIRVEIRLKKRRRARCVFMILQAPRRFRFAEVVRQAFLQCHEG